MLREDTVFGPIFSRRLGSSLGINLLHRRGEGDGCPALLQQDAIGIERARIFLQVVLIVKLGGVHKDAYHGGIILGHAALYQRCMPLMQGSHRRHQPYRLSLGAQSGQRRLQLPDSMYYFHFVMGLRC